MNHRPIHDIGFEIISDYGQRGKPVYYAAVPYVNAMLSLTTLSDRYYEDDARTVLTYALSNLGTWRGETAKRVKAEIKEILSKKA